MTSVINTLPSINQTTVKKENIQQNKPTADVKANTANKPAVISQPPMMDRLDLSTKTNDTNKPSKKQAVYTQPPMLDQEAMMRKAIEDQKKAQKKQKLKQNLSWGISIASGVAIIAMVLMSIRTNRLQTKELEKMLGEQKKGKVDSEFYKRFIKLKDKAGVVSVKEKSTDPLFAEQVLQIKRNIKAPKWLKQLIGVEDEARFFYIHGPSGVGKSYGMEQMAKELDANYLRVQFSDFGSEYQNKSGRNMVEFFDNLVATCKEHGDELFILNIDEADALFVKAGSHNPEEALKFRSAFINAIDKAQGEAKNLIVGCTTNYAPNHPNIDAASLRRIPGRIQFELPKAEQIEALIDIYTRKSVILADDKFMEKNAAEIKKFAKDLEESQYGHGEIKDIIKNALNKYFDDCVTEVDARVKAGEANVNSVRTKFDIKYLIDAKNAKGEAVAKKNTYEPTSGFPF